MKRALLIALLGIFLCNGPSFAGWDEDTTGQGIVFYTVATLPASPVANDLAGVNDGSSAADCTIGGGTTQNVCVWDGSAWTIIGDGQSAGGGNSIYFENNGTSVGNNSSADIYYDATDDLNIACTGQNCTVTFATSPTGANLLLTGSLTMDADNAKTYWGASSDASLYYDGTDLRLNIDSGDFDLNEENVITEGIGTFKTGLALDDNTLGNFAISNGALFVGTGSINLIDDAMIDWGTGSSQVSASDMPDEDIGDITITSGVYTIDEGAVKDLSVDVKEENTSAIVKGQAVYISGSAGAGQSLVGLVNNTDVDKIRMIGLAAEAISQNGAGKVRLQGELSGVDTLGVNAVNPNGETWIAGQMLYATNGGSSGGLTKIRPVSGRIIRAGKSLVGSHNNDTLLVFPYENPSCLAAASGEDLCVRMGDNAGSTKTCFKSYDDTPVTCIYSDGKFLTSESISINADSKKLYLGAGQDASLYYDGIDLYIDPKEAGAGDLIILGDVESDGFTLGTNEPYTAGTGTFYHNGMYWNLNDDLSFPADDRGLVFGSNQEASIYFDDTDSQLFFSDGTTDNKSLADLASGAAETNSLETTITGILDTEIFIGNGADSGTFRVLADADMPDNATVTGWDLGTSEATVLSVSTSFYSDDDVETYYGDDQDASIYFDSNEEDMIFSSTTSFIFYGSGYSAFIFGDDPFTDPSIYDDGSFWKCNPYHPICSTDWGSL